MKKTSVLMGALMLLAATAQAEEVAQATTAAVGASMMGGWIAVATGFAIALAAFGGAFGQGKAAAAALEGVARNPAASGKLLLPLVLSLALIESLVIYAFVIAFQLNGHLAKLIGG
jgi:F-type H+-transporting ATPase subunit c